MIIMIIMINYVYIYNYNASIAYNSILNMMNKWEQNINIYVNKKK